MRDLGPERGPETFILKPNRGEGGVHASAAGRLRRAFEPRCENGSPLIIDEVQTGSCHTGPTSAAGAERR